MKIKYFIFIVLILMVVFALIDHYWLGYPLFGGDWKIRIHNGMCVATGFMIGASAAYKPGDLEGRKKP